MNMAEEDESNFDPDEELRDYDKVAKSLPVFCVSSRAYQKLSGRFQRDNDVSGFKSIDETQVSYKGASLQICGYSLSFSY